MDQRLVEAKNGEYFLIRFPSGRVQWRRVLESFDGRGMTLYDPPYKSLRLGTAMLCQLVVVEKRAF